MHRSVALLGMALTIVVTTSWLRAADKPPESDGQEFFEKKIRPVLVQHCYECHAADSKEIGGNLLLDSRDSLRKGGDTGPAVVLNKPDESLLIKAIRYADDNLQMPPRGKLPAAAIADLEAWVKIGAPDPRIAKPGDTTARIKPAESWSDTLRERRKWWSLQPVQKPPVPEVKNTTVRRPVDRFVQAKLEENGLSLPPSADPRTLIRRLSLVLTGLPPTPAETEELAAKFSVPHSDRDQAYEAIVDKFLTSPHFGEHWARHWMDVVRFTETHGNEWNYEVHHAWRYRDYLIRALNADVPYDQLIREHVAGDLLAQPRWSVAEHTNESVIGTAFYRFGEVNHDDCIGLREIGYDLLDNRLDTLTKAFQATTVACARCHDHKIDAVSMRDYYALLGVLRSSRLVSHPLDAPQVNAEPLARLRELKSQLHASVAEVWSRDAHEISRYMLAAQAKHAKAPEAESLAEGLDAARLEKWLAILAAKQLPLEDPFAPWHAAFQQGTTEKPAAVPSWKTQAENYAKATREREEFNRSVVSFADFRRDGNSGWEVNGQGLRDGPTSSGDFVVSAAGDTLLDAILPAGFFTNGLSGKLNGTLRSPLLPPGKSHISFLVRGRRSSAVRLVSNQCQLNYANYRALTFDEPQWLTFEMPADRESLRTYAELMTMLDNPKFPDQLSALGKDSDNYRVPWEKAVENPRSYFGVTQVVLHDGGAAPKPDLGHFRPLFADAENVTSAEIGQRYVAVIESAIRTWADDKTTDEEVQWLAALLKHGLLSNSSRQTSEIEQLTMEYRRIEGDLSVPRVSPGVGDFGPGCDQPLFLRGDCDRPGDIVPRGYLGVLAPNGASDGAFAVSGSGRLELAERLASPNNPLTSRVMVNRVWHHLFGTGLVRTVDDFGRIGELPSHPELLDYLATQFVEEGWSLKRLIRSLVMTNTFQSASQSSALAREIDPLNRWLSHYPARRMDAESIRDSILVASSRLDRTLYGMSVQPFRATALADRRLFPGPLDGNGRRSIYIKNNLMEAPKFLGAFNLPGGKVMQGRRDVTQVPAQALALLNDPFVLQQADVWASRLIAAQDTSIADRITTMFQTAFDRPPRPDELARFHAAVTQFAQLHGVSADNVLTNRPVWKDMAHAFYNLEEFIYIP
jgi:hypothetical protein